jgi:hypothetical protein
MTSTTVESSTVDAEGPTAVDVPPMTLTGALRGDEAAR